MKRVVTFGELLLSLSARGNHRLVQAEEFTARYTGAEANAAVSLAHFGVEAFVVSKVPAHEIGQACLNALRRFGVHTDYVVRGGDRLGLLYMEVGASQRATKVIYDRAPSSFRQLRAGRTRLGTGFLPARTGSIFRARPPPWARRWSRPSPPAWRPPGNWDLP